MTTLLDVLNFPSNISLAHLIDSSTLLDMVTPFPAAKPSDLITSGCLDFLIKSCAFKRLSKLSYSAVGILKSLHSFFIKSFDPSSCEAFLLGPNVKILFSDKKSTIPLTKGISGPTITVEMFFFNKTE